MASVSLGQFEKLLESVDQLIAIHQRLQTGPGRRREQDALHRAGVVLTVASWQAYIEKVSTEALDLLERYIMAPDAAVPTPSWARTSFYMRRPTIKKAIGDLATPNSDNVRRLLNSSFGFDPFACWLWKAPARKWDSARFSARTNEWLRIRHAIAHGNELPDNLPFIKGANGIPRLDLKLLRECRAHFAKLASLTDAAFAAHLAGEHGTDPPW